MKHREKLWTQGEYLLDGSTVYVLHDTTFMGRPAKENRVYAGLQGPKCPESEKLATARLFSAAPDLVEALESLLERYADLVNCGDCGNWDPEDDDQVIQARKALDAAYGDSQ